METDKTKVDQTEGTEVIEKNEQTGKEPKTFTQEEVNRMMAAEKNQGRMSVLKELGVEDAKTAKEGLAKYKEMVDAQKTDAEKAAEQAASEKAAREAAESKASLLENKLSLVSLGVKSEFVEDVLLIATSRASESKPFSDVVSEMKADEKYAAFFGVINSKDVGTGSKVDSKKPHVDPDGVGKRLAERQKQAVDQKKSYFGNK